MAREFHDEQLPPPRRMPCPPGTFQSLAEKLRKRRRRRAFLWNALATVGTAIVAGEGLMLWLAFREPGQQGPSEYYYGGIACSEVQKLADAYAKGELDAPTREKIRQHVAQCLRCGSLFRSMGMGT
jgi:hypothetical protein